MKKITGIALMLAVLLTATACSENTSSSDSSAPTSQTESSSKSEETSGDSTTNQDKETQVQILKLEKQETYNSAWSEEYNITLVNSEYESVLLTSEDAAHYPQLAKALSENAQFLDSAAKSEYDILTQRAKDIIAAGTEDFKTLVSTVDKHVRRADNTVLSVLADSYSENGLNFGSRGMWGENYDTQTGKVLHLGDVVTSVDDFAKVVENKLFSAYGADIFNSKDSIKEYFQMYGSDGNHWTLDYNGITVYFGEGEIAGEGFGAMNVTVAFAEKPELFNKKYTEVPESYIVGLPMKSTFFTDLDGNGTCEELSISDSYEEKESLYATLDIHTTEVSYVESFFANNCEAYYVKKADGKHYLYVFAEQQTQMYLYVYAVTNTTISKVGEANVSPYYSDGISAVLTDPEGIHLNTYSADVGAGGGVSAGGYFFSVGTNGMPVQR